jgi:hypothetical protein
MSAAEAARAATHAGAAETSTCANNTGTHESSAISHSGTHTQHPSRKRRCALRLELLDLVGTQLEDDGIEAIASHVLEVRCVSY